MRPAGATLTKIMFPEKGYIGLYGVIFGFGIMEKRMETTI